VTQLSPEISASIASIETHCVSIANLATTNIKHISHFAIVEEWQNIAMSL
jgi:hypothetical protein